MTSKSPVCKCLDFLRSCPSTAERKHAVLRVDESTGHIVGPAVRDSESTSSPTVRDGPTKARMTVAPPGSRLEVFWTSHRKLGTERDRGNSAGKIGLNRTAGETPSRR
jgi:hypothetical protein